MRLVHALRRMIARALKLTPDEEYDNLFGAILRMAADKNKLARKLGEARKQIRAVEWKVQKAERERNDAQEALLKLQGDYGLDGDEDTEADYPVLVIRQGDYVTFDPDLKIAIAHTGAPLHEYSQREELDLIDYAQRVRAHREQPQGEELKPSVYYRLDDNSADCYDGESENAAPRPWCEVQDCPDCGR